MSTVKSKLANEDHELAEEEEKRDVLWAKISTAALEAQRPAESESDVLKRMREAFL